MDWAALRTRRVSSAAAGGQRASAGHPASETKGRLRRATPAPAFLKMINTPEWHIWGGMFWPPTVIF